jgi:DNA-binding winged helix-turn-helix (wHTH) protein
MRVAFGDCVFDPDTREVFRSGEPVSLSPKAFRLLEILIGERPRALSKEKLHEVLWPGVFVADANLVNLVADLRAALGDDAKNPSLVRTVPRFGYAFLHEVREAGPEKDGRRRSIFKLLWQDREIALAEGENGLGRDEESVAWIDVYSVSRHHARIVVAGEEATLEDLGSKNGTFVRGRRIRGPVPIEDGDTIRIGTVSLVLRRFISGRSTQTVGGR